MNERRGLESNRGAQGRIHLLLGGLMVGLVVLISCEQTDGVRKGLTMHESQQTARTVDKTEPAVETTQAGEVVVPVVQEELDIQTRKTETGRVRINKTVQEREVVVNEPSVHEEVEVERVPIDQFVDEPLPIRHEGDTMIIPVLEEVPVVVKRLKLKEELHVTKRQVTTPHSQPVQLRREEVTIERVDPKPPVSE